LFDVNEIEEKEFAWVAVVHAGGLQNGLRNALFDVNEIEDKEFAWVAVVNADGLLSELRNALFNVNEFEVKEFEDKKSLRELLVLN
jgi:hypothetical protein